MLTGLYCPGCGGLRAVHALAHGDPLTALGLNPLVVVLIPVAIVLWGRWTLGAWRGAAGTGAGALPGAAVVPDATVRGGTGPGAGVRAGTGADGIARPSPRKYVQPVHGWLLLTLVLVFWVVRNLPFGEFLAP
ncbi:DUF2752 domain-containing protein [Streptosporangium sp. DT93]